MAPNLVIFEPACVPAPKHAGPPAYTVLTPNLHMFCLKFAIINFEYTN